MGFSKEIFHSYDIRGKLEDVTEEVAAAVGAGICAKFGAKKIVVGRDMRETSPALLEAVIAGARRYGADVIDIGLTNTSLWNYATTTIEGVDAGIMVTASHNPASYNGIKVITGEGRSLAGETLWQITQDLAPPVQEEQGRLEERDMVESYIDACVYKIGSEDLSRTKIVFDYGNGMGARTVRPLIKRVGIDAVELYPEPDAHFPHHEANPAKEETLVDLKQAVLEQEADFGIALDGDHDRLKLVDNTGKTVASDTLLALLAQHVLKQHPGKGVAVTVNMGWAVREAIEEAGGSVIESAVGRSNVPKAMMENDGVLGGEVSGHFMFKDFHYLEAVDHAIVRVIALWKESGKTLSELAEPLRRYANSGEVNLEVAHKDKAIENVLKHYQDQATSVSTIDGIKLTFDHDWWFSLRKSNTEPVVRLTLEATSEARMQEKRDEIVAMIENMEI